MRNIENETRDSHFPGYLLGAVTLYWSWTVDIWPLGVVLAIVLEAPRWISWKIQPKDRDIKNIANLTALVFAIFCLNQFLTQLHVGIYTITAWLPLVIFTLVVVQIYSSNQKIPLWALLSRSQDGRDRNGNETSTYLDLRTPYFFVAIVASSIYGAQQQYYFVCVSLFIIFFLWHVKPERKLSPAWLVTICLFIALSLGMQTGIYKFAGVVQAYTASWFTGKWNKRNSNRNSTAIGQVGELKLSDNIALRVRSSNNNVVLLQQGVYNRYHGGVWHNSDNNFNFLARSRSGTHYNLLPKKPVYGNKLEIFADLTDGEGTLAIPKGSYRLSYTGTGDFSKNQFGITKIAGAPEQLQLTVSYHHNLGPDDSPSKSDLEIAPPYNKLMDEIATELGLKNVSPKEAAGILKHYFDNQFKYSLIQDESDIEARPLHHFLKKSQKGHCEYFATTTALILRAAGIPTRYATGFLMTEFDSGEDLFIVRNRHAHAWTLAYIDKQWVELDFTPSTWVEMEAENQSVWLPVSDTVSHWYYKTRKWWNSEDSTLKLALLVTSLLIALLWLLKVFKLDKMKLHWSQQPGIAKTENSPTRESPFNEIVKTLEKHYFRRNESDTLKQWIQGIATSNQLDTEPVYKMLDLHYQYRFADNADNVQLRTKLNKDVRKWLNSFSQASISDTKHKQIR